MPMTVTRVHDPDGTDNNAGVYLIAFDNSYPASGYVVTGATFGRTAIHSLTPVQTGTVNRLINYDPSGSDKGTIRIWTALNTEAGTGSDQSTISCRVRVVGPIA